MRWPDLSRLGIELRVFVGPPPLLVARGDLDMAAHGFERRGTAWVRDMMRFESADLKRWFPDFVPADIKEMAREQVVVSDMILDGVPDEAVAISFGAADRSAVATKDPWQMRIANMGLMGPELFDGLASQSGGTIRVVRNKNGTFTVSNDLGGELQSPQATNTDASGARDAAQRLYGLELKNELGDLIGQHRRLVKAAIASGKPVPAEVLSDYPDIQTRIGAGTTASQTTPSTKENRPNPEAEVSQDKADGKAAEAEKPKRLSSEEWRNEGMTPEQIAARDAQSHAEEFAMQIENDSRDDDFSPGEIPAALRYWANDPSGKKFDLDALRTALIAELKKRKPFPFRSDIVKVLEKDGKAASKGKPPVDADAPYERLLNLKSTKLLTTSGNRKLYSVTPSAEFKAEFFEFGRGWTLPRSDLFELSEKAKVTGNPSDNGYILIDKRDQLTQRGEGGKPVATKETVVKEFRSDDGAAKWIDQNVSQDQLPNTGVGEIKLSSGKDTSRVVGGRVTNTRSLDDTRTVFRLNDGQLAYVASDANAKGSSVIAVASDDSRFTPAKESHAAQPVPEHGASGAVVQPSQPVAGAALVEQNATPPIDNQPSVAPIQDKAAPASDKNIGREWNSPYGRQKIVNVIPGKAEFGIQPMYEVQTADTGAIRCYSADRIEETIRGDEHRLTPEYEKEQAEKAEINRLRIERDARAEAKREAENAEIAAFAASKRMAPPNAEKARAALTAQISANGTPISRKNLVEKLIAEGRTVGQFNGKRTLETSDGIFFDERQLTKTGIDYAEYLIERKFEPKPAEPSPLESFAAAQLKAAQVLGDALAKPKVASEEGKPVATQEPAADTPFDSKAFDESIAPAKAAGDVRVAPGQGGAAADYAAPTSLEDARRRWSAASISDPVPERGPSHAALMAAVRKALAAKLFYNRDVDNFVAKELGVTAEQRKAGTSEDPSATGPNDRVEGGAFAYDVYLARKAVEREMAKQAEFAAAERMQLNVGLNVGRVKLNDGKMAVAATVESITPTGVVLTAQRGPQKIRITTGYVELGLMSERAGSEFFKQRAPSDTAIVSANVVDGGLFAQSAQGKETPASLNTASGEVSSDQLSAQDKGAPALTAIAERQPTRLGQRVVRILDAAATRDRLQTEPDFEVAIANPPFADLCVEALAGEGFTLTRYGQVENGGERVVDAEVVFHIDADGHLLVHETCSYSAELGEEVRGRDTKFADAMVKTLIEQGFGETEVTRKEKARIEDAGEKIGGARKDQYHRITLDVLGEMNDREKILYLKKDAIWPPISIEAAREAGVPVELLVMGRELRALVAPGIKDPAVAETYVRVVSGLRDAYAASTSPSEFISAIERTAIEVGVIEAREQPAYLGSSRMVTLRGTTLLYTDLQKAGWDYRKLNKIFWDLGVLSRKGRVFKEWCEQFPDTDGYALLASRYARSGARVVEDNDKIPSRPHLASIQRMGLPDERTGDIAAEDLIARFGFRGVEFGNWLPQDERQDVLNKAYDAFSTLALVLGFPDKMMSLEGTLALAFGSRGKSRAAAHYEPGRTVINLTRMNGAGSTGHEYYHALDDWFAGVIRKHFADKGDVGIPADAMYATEFAIQRTKSRRRRPATTRATTRDLRWHKDLFADVAPWFHMAESLLQRSTTLDELKHRLERKTAVWGDAIERWACFGIRVNGVAQEDAEKHAKEAVQELDPTALERLCNRLFGEDPDNHAKMMECVRGLRVVQKAQAQIEQHPESVQLSLAATDFFENARLLDSKTPSKPYYSRARELGARAFESYVFDKLAAMGARDDYLVHGVEETRFSEGYRGNPYPAGEDRREINRRMEDALKKVAEKFVSPYTYETTGDLFAPVPRMAACR